VRSSETLRLCLTFEFEEPEIQLLPQLTARFFIDGGIQQLAQIEYFSAQLHF
jgi:hypothetical protein